MTSSFSKILLTQNNDVLRLFEINLYNQFDRDKYVPIIDILRKEMDSYLHILKDNYVTPCQPILNEIEHYKEQQIKILLIEYLKSNTVCGYITCCPASYDNKELIIIDLYLNESYRNKNYSEHIFKMLTTIAKKYKFTSMTLNVAASNISATKAYTKAGYKPTHYYMKKDL